MKKLKLANGLNLEVKDSAVNNMELLDELVALDEGNAFAISRVLDIILDQENKKKLYNHLREDGVVQVTKVVDAMKEIFEKLGDAGKN